MKQKILYVVDFLLHQYNSVRDISVAVLEQNAAEDREQILFHRMQRPHYPAVCTVLNGYKTYTDEKSAASDNPKRLSPIGLWRGLLLKLSHLTGRSKQHCEKAARRRLKRVLRTERPDLVIFFSLPPDKKAAELCVKAGIPYISVLYDTYVSNPKVNVQEAVVTEHYIMEHSRGYFVPDFFYGDYQKQYTCDKLRPYALPLLIDREAVRKAYKSARTVRDFVYFGQIQSFRNGDAVAAVFRELGATLDVFTTGTQQNDPAFAIHPAITGTELHAVAAGAKFLVAIDNSAPYQHFLPSKAYLYSSFTKPVLALGNNEHSALLDFFADHPDFYYHRLGDPIDGLSEFFTRKRVDAFDEALYERYLAYAPEAALRPLCSTVCDVLENA